MRFTLSLLTLTLLACTSAPRSGPHAAGSERSSDVTSREEQAALTPDGVLAELRAGNERFTSDRALPRDHLSQVRATATGQYPKAVVLSCLDSRIPPEIVFDQGIGDLFVARVAGNFENADILGSMEFATQVAGAKLIVVMGHSECGAIKGACDGIKLGNLTEALANVQPAIDASRSVPGPHDSKNHEYVAAVTHANVDQTVRDITARSPVLAALVAEGKLKVVGASYDLSTGRVSWH